MWKPITIPLVSGQDDSVAATDAREPSLVYAENCDFGKKGAVRGRPGYARKISFHERMYVPDMAAVVADNGYTDPNGIVSTARPKYLLRHRDPSGERPAVTGPGRTWTFEDDISSGVWADKLHGASWSSDRIYTGRSGLRTSATTRYTSAYSYYPIGNSNEAGVGSKKTRLLDADGTFTTSAFGYSISGGAARCSGYDCVFGYESGAALRLLTRAPNAQTLATYVLTGSLSGAAVTPVAQGADNPALCCDYDQTVLFGAAKYNAGTNLNIFRINPATGAVLTTQILAVGANITGLWLTNTDVATNKLVLVYSRAGSAGLFTKVYNATTLADLAIDTTFNSAGAAGTGPCACGVAEAGEVWLAYKEVNLGSTGNLVIGKRSLTAATSYLVKEYEAQPLSPHYVDWWIAHQPVKVANRTLIGVQQYFGSPYVGGTWTSLDFTDVHRAPSPGTAGQSGGLDNPTIAAAGPDGGSGAFQGCSSAVVVGNTFRFMSVDATEFSSSGIDFCAEGITEVRLAAPQADTAGEYTLIGGSVPHLLGNGYCVEQCFQGMPGISIGPSAGIGDWTAGTYTGVAVWKWTDESGTVHRSAPSNAMTFFTVPGSNRLSVDVTQPQLTERYASGRMEIEIYVTDIDQPATAPKYLQATLQVIPSVTLPLFVSALYGGTILQSKSTQSRVLYTDGGVFSNGFVNADGGVATLGRRVWVSDGTQLFASKLLRDGEGPSFNAEGSLVVNLPATSGRVRALRACDDKLYALCDRGVYITQGEGPDDAGVGRDFLEAYKVTDLGCLGTRMTCTTNQGVVFLSKESGATDHSATYTDGTVGGLWLLDRGLNATQVSGPVQSTYLNGTTPVDMAYNPEREVLYLATTTKLLVYDMRAKLWSTWTYPDGTIQSICVANGQLWIMGTSYPGVFNLLPGFDTTSTTSAYSMIIRTKHLFANGQDGLGWARVRTVRLLGEGNTSPAATGLTASAALDQSGVTDSAAWATVLDNGNGATWPRGRYAPEWRLAVQKCSSIQLTFTTALPTMLWTAIELDIQPIGRAPASDRR